MGKRYMRHISVAIFSVFALFLGGCGTLTNQSSQNVNISASDSQTIVAEVNSQRVNLPVNISISRADGAIVRIRAEDNPCYEDTEFNIAGQNKISGSFWANLIFTTSGTGTTGAFIDVVSGGMWEYSNPNFIVPVTKKDNCTK